MLGELGYKPYEFYCLMHKDLNDIVEGYNNKIKRENERMLFDAKVARKAAYITILPHVKNLSEGRFNADVWPIFEEEEKPDDALPVLVQSLPQKASPQERLQKMQAVLQKHNLRLSEARRKKELKNK